MNKTVLIIVAIIIVGGVGWFFLKKSGQTAVDTTSQTSSVSTTDTSSINSGSTASTGTTGDVGTGTVQQFTVDGSNFKFEPAQLTVKKGDTVKITFKNSGGTHDFVLDEFNVRTKQVQSGELEEVQFVADKAGSFEYYCSVGNHRQMGMKGTLIVN